MITAPAEARFQDGDVGDGRTTNKNCYNAIGPFTTWHVRVSSDLNKAIDLATITEVVLEFHGSSYAFDEGT